MLFKHLSTIMLTSAVLTGASSAATLAQNASASAAVKAADSAQVVTRESAKVTSLGFPEAKVGGTFTTRLKTYPRTLNSWTSGDIYTGTLSEIVQGTLTTVDTETWGFIPYIAESWELAADKKSVVFKIDKRAKWSDGSPITADDVIFTWDTLFSDKSDTAAMRAYLDAVKSWKKIDSHTVSFDFKRIDFENVDKVGRLYLMQKSVYSKGDFNRDFNNIMVGAGPYVIDQKETRKGRRVVLTRNENWWGWALPFTKNTYNFQKIIYNVIDDDRVAFEALKKGQLNWLEFEDSALDMWAKEVNAKEFDGSGKFAKLVWPRINPLVWNGIALNMRKAPLNDVKFREVLQILFNEDFYTKRIFHGLQVPLLGPFGNYSEYASPRRKIIPFDIERAKKLLTELGYTKVDSDGTLYKEDKGERVRAEISILFASPAHEKYLTIFKDDARKAGVNINLKLSEWAAAMKQIDDWKFDAFVMGWGGDPVPAPSQQWYGKFADEKKSSNFPGFKNKEADKLIEEAPAIFDKAKRLEAFHRLEDLIVAEHPYIWRWQQKDHYFLYNKELLAVPSKIYKFSGSSTRQQPWPFWWHPKAK